MYGRFGSREHGGQGFGLAQRLLAHPDNLPGSFPAPWSANQGQEGGTPPADGTPPPQVNPLRQQMADFFKGVYDQPGDATLADYLGTINNGAYVPPTGMPQGFTDRVNSFFTGHPNMVEGLANRYGAFASNPIPDSRVSQFASSGHWPRVGMGLWYGLARSGQGGQGGDQQDPQGDHGNFFRRRRHGFQHRSGSGNED